MRALLLTILMAGASSAHAAPKSLAAPLVGRWVMHLYLGDLLFEDEVEVSLGTAGAFGGTLTVPGRFTAPLENVQVTADGFRFEITADEGAGPFHVLYEGRFHASGDTYVGFATLVPDQRLLGGFVGQRRPSVPKP